MVAARRVFCDHGYRNSTISRVAEEAELSPGTIYIYFKSKEELFLSLTMRMFHYLNMRLAHITDQKRRWSLEKRIEAVCDALIDSYEQDPKLMTFTLLMQGNEVHTKLSKNLVGQLEAQYRKTIHTIVELIIEDTPEASVILQPNKIAKFIWSQFTGIILLNKTLNTIDQVRKETLHEELKWWVTTFFYGLLISNSTVESGSCSINMNTLRS